MLYLKNFETDAERTAFTENYEYVSYTDEIDKVHVHHHDYSYDYLTFIIKSSGTIQYSANTQYNSSYDNSLSYSMNDAEWSVKQNNITIQVDTGDIIRFKGNCGLIYNPRVDKPRGIGRFNGSTALFDI